MHNTFELAALRGRSRALFLYSYKTKSLTDAHAATILTNNAIRLGLVAPRDPVPGKNLGSWAKDRTGKSVQIWAAFSAIDLLTQYMMWHPESEDELALWAVSQVRQYPLLIEVADFINVIPEKTDLVAAQEALQKALTLSAPYALPREQSQLYQLPESATAADRALAAVNDRGKPMTCREMSMTLYRQHNHDTEEQLINTCKEAKGLYVTRKNLAGSIINLDDDIDESTVYISATRQGHE